MDKPASLRALIVESVPEFKTSPERLRIWIRSGKIASRLYRVNQGFQYNFRLDIEVRDFSGHPDQIFLPIILWLKKHQPDTLLNHDRADQAINFEADYLDNNAVDLDISLTLTEAVDVRPYEDGYQLVHREEPAIAGEEQVIDTTAVLKRIYDQNGDFLVGYPAEFFPPDPTP